MKFYIFQLDLLVHPELPPSLVICPEKQKITIGRQILMTFEYLSMMAQVPLSPSVARLDV